MAEFIVPDRRQAAVQTLRAIDEVLSAIRHLRQLAESRYKGPAVETWNLSAMENNLGVFSQDVSFFNQTFKGDTAYVTLQEKDNVPLVHAEFILTDGRWLYRPEGTPTALPGELKMLAAILWDLCDRVNSGARVDEFLDEFARRVDKQVQRVVTVTDRPRLAVGSPGEP